MHKVAGKIGFNTDHVKKLTKEEFIKQFKPAYPKHDLSAEYDNIVPPKKEEPKTEPAKLPVKEE